jgi:predicted membrane protein
MLVLLVGLPLCGALFAGFTVARERAATSPVVAAAWGALVGPVWATGLAIVNALLQDTLYGHAQGESVFGIVLVFGALVGALGGYLAAGPNRASAGDEPSPSSAAV